MKPTFSSWGRAEACAASHALPAVVSTGELADVGNVIHDYLRAVAPARAMKPVALAKVASDETRQRCSNINTATALAGLDDITTEESFAIHVETGAVRLLGKDLDRDYPETAENEMVGTLDVRARRWRDGVPSARDWKTGFAELPPASEHPQVQAQVVALAGFAGADVVEGGLLRVDENGEVEPDLHDFDAFEIDGILGRMARTLERVRKAEAKVAAGMMPTVYPGAHCRYCPALPQCPAHVSLARSMLGELSEIESQMASLSPADAGRAWLLAKRASTILDNVIEGLKAYADTTPIPLPDGTTLTPVLSGRTYIDGKRALVMLREFGATDAELQSLEKETRFPKYLALKDKTVKPARKPAKLKESA